VDDFAGQEDASVGKALARLVGVINRSIDPIAEAELTGEMDRQPTRPMGVIVGFDLFDDRAVVAVRKHAGHGVL
jgi:hypothetical protein